MIIGFYLAEIFLFAKRDLEEQFFCYFKKGIFTKLSKVFFLIKNHVHYAPMIYGMG